MQILHDSRHGLYRTVGVFFVPRFFLYLHQQRQRPVFLQLSLTIARYDLLHTLGPFPARRKRNRARPTRGPVERRSLIEFSSIFMKILACRLAGHPVTFLAMWGSCNGDVPSACSGSSCGAPATAMFPTHCMRLYSCRLMPWLCSCTSSPEQGTRTKLLKDVNKPPQGKAKKSCSAGWQPVVVVLMSTPELTRKVRRIKRMRECEGKKGL